MDAAHRLLRDRGHRLTPQRQLVWEVLRSAEGHLTAEEIHERVSSKVPGINLASVYRTLTLLDELDLAKEVRIGDGKGHWEVAHPDDDFHLVCRQCGAVHHHSGGDLVEQVRDHLVGGHDFMPEDVDLVVHGLCAACARAAL